MIKTIDVTNITDEMIEVAAGSAQLRAMAGVTEHTALIRGSILAALIAAPAVEPAQRCNCCGYLVTDSEHRGCLRAAKQEPAQVVPGKCEPVAEVLWYEPMLHEPQTKKGHKIIDASLSWMEKAPLGTKLYAAPPAIDDETKRMVLELCRLIIDKAGPDSMITRHMAQVAEKICEKLEAGNGTA